MHPLFIWGIYFFNGMLIDLKLSSALTFGFIQIFLTSSGNFFVLVSDFHDCGFLKSVVVPNVSSYLRVREVSCITGTCGLTEFTFDVIRQWIWMLEGSSLPRVSVKVFFHGQVSLPIKCWLKKQNSQLYYQQNKLIWEQLLWRFSCEVMLDSCDPMDCSPLRRILCPWGLPGKNTVLGCRSLL